ncbi:beta-N-acetylhexosaminidase [Oceanicola sp. S124]|uniref:beta-N-acetylhexosaminidase n=1 Tax=Oceanicola sp. S124 TaxID=1042378 RepID=UPI000255A71C|nr:beta-N-acetylhexosaminidase [Oceanicola sp. S124]
MAGATILDPTGPRLSAEEARVLRDADPWGFILFARNIESLDQTRALCDELRQAVGRNAPILVDQEGGRVQRLRAPLATDWPPALEFAEAAGDGAVEAMRLRFTITALELRAAGIDVDCAPLADVALPETHPFLRNRCYGTDAARVASLARAVAQGLMAGGVLPVVKHMPGHGRAQVDSHADLPHVTAGWDALDAVDFAPFKVLNDLPMAMTAHLLYDAIDPEMPATLSPKVLQVIRNHLGYDGLVMTDDISMQALSGDAETRALAALDAGCDLVLYCNAPLADRARVAEAAGAMTPTAEARAARALEARRDPATLDIDELKAKLTALLNG